MFLFPYVLKQAEGNNGHEPEPGQMFGMKEFAALGPITWALMVNIKNDVILINLLMRHKL